MKICLANNFKTESQLQLDLSKNTHIEDKSIKEEIGTSEVFTKKLCSNIPLENPFLPKYLKSFYDHFTCVLVYEIHKYNYV